MKTSKQSVELELHNGIQVTLRPWTLRGSLLPKYISGIHILVAENSLVRKWPYGINIESLLILDIGADRLLASFEFLIPKKLWKTIPTLGIPQVQRKASIEFCEASLARKFFDLPIRVNCDLAKSNVQILFGTEESDSFWIALSECCMALINGNQLIGFFVILE